MLAIIFEFVLGVKAETSVIAFFLLHHRQSFLYVFETSSSKYSRCVRWWKGQARMTAWSHLNVLESEKQPLFFYADPYEGPFILDSLL